MIIGSLALAAAGAFTGASLYVNYVEQPARLALTDDALIKEWEPSDHRGFIRARGLSRPLAALFGFIAFRELDDVRWLFGALVAHRELALHLSRHRAAQQSHSGAHRRRCGA